MNTQELLVLRQTEVEAAAQAFKQAQAQLQLTQVHYRLAHISVQPEPLQGLENNEDLTLREKMIAAAYFVVNGQLPQINPKPKEVEDVDITGRESDEDTPLGEGDEASEDAADEVDDKTSEGTEGTARSRDVAAD